MRHLDVQCICNEPLCLVCACASVSRNTSLFTKGYVLYGLLDYLYSVSNNLFPFNGTIALSFEQKQWQFIENY